VLAPIDSRALPSLRIESGPRKSWVLRPRAETYLNGADTGKGSFRCCCPTLASRSCPLGGPT